MARKSMRDLLLSVGRSPELVGELISKQRHSERVESLINHKIVLSEAEVPTREEFDCEPHQLSAPSKNDEAMMLEAKPAQAIIALGGSDEGQTASTIICAGSYEGQSASTIICAGSY